MLESKDGNGRGLETAQVFKKKTLYADIKIQMYTMHSLKKNTLSMRFVSNRTQKLNIKRLV